MRRSDDKLILSATDLANFLGCRHRTALDMAAAGKAVERPHYEDPLLDLLIERGLAHEKRYVDSLRAAGRQVVDLSAVAREELIDATTAAIRSGAEVIVQGALGDDRWYGKPDVLERVAIPSALGDWSYEVLDTKLALETRAGTILQLCLYSDLLAALQGKRPERFHVVTPDPVRPRLSYRFDDYGAYYRMVKARLAETAARPHDEVAAEHYPEPVDLCDVCHWSSRCSKRRRADDHLSLVAGITRVQRRELQERGVTTVAGLAGLEVPLAFKPSRGSADGYLKAREQARLQIESRDQTVPRFELLEVEPGFGLSRLPEPSPGDVFLDLEGDPFSREGGREYLFGVVTLDPDGSPRYQGVWATDDAEERAAFEWLIDLVIQAWDEHEGMHVYHYAPYEPSALKRLMGRHATRMDELDRLLRGERFVDLYAVVRRGMRVGVERYSIKNLEPLYGFEREVRLAEANRYLRAMEAALWWSAVDGLAQEIRDGVEGYNRDDCVSTLRLRDWLEAERERLIASGVEVPRPVPKEDEPSEQVDEKAARVEALRRQLLAGVPELVGERTAEQQARWLLGYLLDWHRREDKAGWWEYFRLRELPEDELADEPKAISGLELVGRVDEKLHKRTKKPTGTVTDRYRYPPQEMEIDERDDLKLQTGGAFGKVVRVDRDRRLIDVVKGKNAAGLHPSAAFAHTYFNPKAMEDSLLAIAERAVESGGVTIDAGAPDGAARTLLLRAPPRLAGRSFDGAAADLPSAIDTAMALDHSLLAIQGPPGAGKTYLGAHVICALVQAGRRVGVTATSHKVIANLQAAILKAAAERGVTVRLGHKVDDDDAVADPSVVALRDNGAAREALANGELDVVGGTTWLWARADMRQSVDVLVVDEAGQMSLANVVAVSPAAASLILLGDPQQLEQPQQGSHPDGVGGSALQHLLGDHPTMPPELGLFLPTTWRLAPSICGYTSELFYEGKLTPKDGLERQLLAAAGELDGSGLRIVPVAHQGNRNYSVDEVETVGDLVTRLLASGATFTDRHGVARPIDGGDVLVVAPYNAQVNRLAERLGAAGVAVGTVDKFQGQEAPVVIYSMATSSAEDAPRGMAFLYSLNRLNVATSRARALVVLALSPLLLEPECRTPGQMRLANALCRFRELAEPIHGLARSGQAATR